MCRPRPAISTTIASKSAPFASPTRRQADFSLSSSPNRRPRYLAPRECLPVCDAYVVASRKTFSFPLGSEAGRGPRKIAQTVGQRSSRSVGLGWPSASASGPPSTFSTKLAGLRGASGGLANCQALIEPDRAVSDCKERPQPASAKSLHTRHSVGEGDGDCPRSMRWVLHCPRSLLETCGSTGIRTLVAGTIPCRTKGPRVFSAWSIVAAIHTTPLSLETRLHPRSGSR